MLKGLVVSAAAGLLVSCASVGTGLVDGRLRPCPSSPNCATSEGAEPDVAALPLGPSGDAKRCARRRAALAAVLALLEGEEHVEIAEVGDGYVHAVFRSRVLGFPDDVELRVDLEAGVVHMRSASRYGYADFGVNRARLERLGARWAELGN